MIELYHYIKMLEMNYLFLQYQGKPRKVNIFETMKETRKELEQGLKICKKNELQIKIKKCIHFYSMW